MGPSISDFNIVLIILLVVQLSGRHCIINLPSERFLVRKNVIVSLQIRSYNLTTFYKKIAKKKTLGLIHTRHNIAIKRYCDKKIFLSHGFQD